MRVDKVTQGDMAIAGRLQGGALPAGTPTYADWLHQGNAGNYLLGALSTPYGAQAQSIGDVSLKQYQKFGLLDFAQQVQGVLVGKNVAAWEKEAAQLALAGQSLNAVGQFVAGAAKVLEGMASVSTAPDISGVSTKVFEGATKITQGFGQLTSASGQAIIARSLELRYNAIKDLTKYGDQTLTVPVPAPRPSLVFGELMLKGSLAIQTNLVSGEYITTPGSKHSEHAPEDYVNGSKGSFPLYNVPLGKNSILKMPSFGLAISYSAAAAPAPFGAVLRIKERPYIAVNNNVLGKVGGIYTLRLVVSTYNRQGQLMETRKSNAYTFNTAVPGIMPLTGTVDVSGLLSEATLQDNLASLGGRAPTPQQLGAWVQLAYELNALEPTRGLHKNGELIVPIGSTYAQAKTAYAYESSTTLNPASRAAAIVAASFPTYTFGNDPSLGSSYILGNAQDNFQALMASYCTARAAASASVVAEPASAARSTLAVAVPDSLPAPSPALALQAWPNPSDDGVYHLRYQVPQAGAFSIVVYDLMGRALLTAHEQALAPRQVMSSDVLLTAAPAGEYLVVLSFSNGERQQVRLLKR